MSGEWRDLFDGESLDGWFATGDPDGWFVEDGELICRGDDPGITFLCTEERYGDFDFDFEFNFEAEANSGVYFRWSELSDRSTGMEIQILDTHDVDDPDKADCGALYDMKEPSSNAVTPPGEWNHMRLTCDGATIREELNGERVLDVDIDDWDTPGENPDGTENKFAPYAMAELPRQGRIGLQDHGGRVRFRNVRIRER